MAKCFVWRYVFLFLLSLEFCWWFLFCIFFILTTSCWYDCSLSWELAQPVADRVVLTQLPWRAMQWQMCDKTVAPTLNAWTSHPERKMPGTSFTMCSVTSGRLDETISAILMDNVFNKKWVSGQLKINMKECKVSRKCHKPK